MKFYMTLGSGQPYYPGYFVCIADNENEARQLTSEALNNRWCGTYDTLDQIHPNNRIQWGYITKEYGITITSTLLMETEQ
ncbi:MAG: hypothetical protein NTX52_05395 [Planctomycetota bacterium]|nr:hypothetical protein [Planctomycetota bacterium]